MKTVVSAATVAFLLVAGPASAESVTFDGAWQPVSFPLMRSTQFEMLGDRIEIRAENATGLAWTRLDPRFADATTASWSWSSERSVPPTDLTQRGGEDRNAALSFVFAGPETARRAAQGASITSLMGADDVRILSYVYGGDRPAGSGFASPSRRLEGRGFVIVKRPAGPGSFSETADIRADFRAAFGEEAGVLVGLAVSGDSDDTDTLMVSRIERLTLR
ncbi:MAG: DUF3047 domain-containing protein [Rubricella sp.]